MKITTSLQAEQADVASIMGAIYGDGGEASLSVHVDVRPADSLREAA